MLPPARHARSLTRIGWLFFLYVPDAWIDTARHGHKDGVVGHMGYEIKFNRYFYRYVPPWSLEEIEADIQTIERDILEMLKDMSIGQPG